MNNNTPMTVSELSRSVKYQLETKFPALLVQGEISNFKAQTSGHFYFSLKDSEAQIACVMFRADGLQLKRLPKEGDQVSIRGSLNVYPPSGKYQIIVKELVYSGLGALLLQLEELKIKLHQKGYFRNDRKKPLPKFPKVIGIVTSPTGAVIQDILNVLSRRHQGFQVVLNPVKVQGEGSALEIANAIKQMNEHQLCDVMIIGRGGGSIEDLWSFNDELVANTIFESKIPIIAAIGHETDHTIADYVADFRAPTPSAAAEIVMQEGAAVQKHLFESTTRLNMIMSNFLKYEKQRLSAIQKHPLFTSPYALLGYWMQKLDQMHNRLEVEKPSAKIGQMKTHLDQIKKRIDTNIENNLHNKQLKLNKIVDILKAIDPKNLLNKGYTILFSEKGESVIKSVQSLKKNETVRLLLKDGSAKSIITDITYE